MLQGTTDEKMEGSASQNHAKTANLNKVVVGDLPPVNYAPSAKADTARGNPGQTYELNSNSSMAQIVVEEPE